MVMPCRYRLSPAVSARILRKRAGRYFPDSEGTGPPIPSYNARQRPTRYLATTHGSMSQSGRNARRRLDDRAGQPAASPAPPARPRTRSGRQASSEPFMHVRAPCADGESQRQRAADPLPDQADLDGGIAEAADLHATPAAGQAKSHRAPVTSCGSSMRSSGLLPLQSERSTLSRPEDCGALPQCRPPLGAPRPPHLTGCHFPR
jgi:hypothetical protein